MFVLQSLEWVCNSYKKILSSDKLVQIVLQTGASLGLGMLLCNTFIDGDTC